MKAVKIGSSIEVNNKFLTVESYQGDIGLFNKGKLVQKRTRKEADGVEYTYNKENYKLI